MNVGEFFISLGIKGANTTLTGLKSVKEGLGGLTSMSLEAKAAILAVAYGFQQMMMSSSKVGTQLTNFNALTGISMQTLQQYQYAARKVGVSNEEMQSSFESVFQVMTNMRMGKGAPEGLAQVQNLVGFDSTRALTDTQYVMEQLQKYADKEQDVTMKDSVLKSFGLSNNVISGMNRHAFEPGKMQGAPTYSNAEIGQLDKANAAWSELSNKVQMAFGHFNAKHGVEIVNGLSSIINSVLKLANAFMKLAEAFHLFQGIGKVLNATASAVGWIADKTNQVMDHNASKDKKLPSLKNSTPELSKLDTDKTKSHNLAQWNEAKNKPLVDTSGFMSYLNNHMGMQKSQAGSAVVKTAPQASPITPGAVAPKVSNTQSSTTHNTEINQSLHFQHPGTNAQQVGNDAGKAVKDAHFQINAEGT